MEWVHPLVSLLAIIVLSCISNRLFPIQLKFTPVKLLQSYKLYAPDASPGTPLISQDQTSAILPLLNTKSEVGVITLLGDKMVCRTLSQNTEGSWQVEGTRITLKLSDFAQPTIIFHLSEADTKKAIDSISPLLSSAGNMQGRMNVA